MLWIQVNPGQIIECGNMLLFIGTDRQGRIRIGFKDKTTGDLTPIHRDVLSNGYPGDPETAELARAIVSENNRLIEQVSEYQSRRAGFFKQALPRSPK